jgi:ABC-type lipoprotein export system ATPase subunit
MAILDQLNKEQGITIILVTHETDIAAYAGREVVIQDGRVLTDRRTQSNASLSRAEI